MEIIKQELINKDFEIVLIKYDWGYEICVSNKNYKTGWYYTNGIYTRKKDALKIYAEVRKNILMRG